MKNTEKRNVPMWIFVISSFYVFESISESNGGLKFVYPLLIGSPLALIREKIHLLSAVTSDNDFSVESRVAAFFMGFPRYFAANFLTLCPLLG